MKALLLSTLPCAPTLTFAQGVGIGTTTPSASAALDVSSTNKGVLLPRVSSTSSVGSPAAGLVVYQTASPAGYYYYDGSTWQQMVPASSTAFVRNQTTQQTGTNFNVSGTGVVGGQLTANALRLGASATPGVVLTPTTGSANMLAVAYGQLGLSSGSPVTYSTSDNYTVTHGSTGSYTLSFTAASGLSTYNFDNAPIMTTLYGPANSPGFITFTGGTGVISVYISSVSGATTLSQAPADRDFSIIVFTP